MSTPAWLKQAVFYQVYPQSFFDSNADGIGDLEGIVTKLDYLTELGVNALWINPCFESPFRDAGYDVSNYLSVASRYGDNAALERLVAEAHRRDIRVCLDLVAGHTSDQHPWFIESSRPETNEYSDRYIWTHSPWFTVDGDLRFISGTTDRTGAFAINFFAHQPALNYGFGEPNRSYQQGYDEPGPCATRAALKEVMAFWLDRGVDGFRVDMAASLVKRDPYGIHIRRLWRDVRQWLDANYTERVLIAEWGEPERAIDAGFDVDFMLHFGVPGYDALFFGPESRFPPGRTACYFDASAEGDFRRFWETFSFQHERIRGKGYLSIPSGNHDIQRPSVGRDRADLKVIQTFLLTWPQVPFLYYGDEIGMRYLADLPSKEGGYERTGSRTPMQWDDSALAGFSGAPEQLSHLPIDPSPERPTVAAQRADEDSLWHHVERLIYLRQTEPDLLPDAPIELLSEGNGYPLVYRRGETLLIAINPGSHTHEVRLERTGDAEPVLAYHCRVGHEDSGWILHIGARGYGIFGIR